MIKYNYQEGNQLIITEKAEGKRNLQEKGENMDIMKEFVAYSKKLLRVLNKIKSALIEKNYDEVEKLIDELIEDTESDIQA